MLAHVGGHKGIALGHFAQGLDHGLWLDDAAVALVIREQTAVTAPFVDLLPPAGDSFFVRRLADFLQRSDHFGQHAFHRTYNRHVGLDGLGDGRRVDVDMNDLGIRAELARAVDHPVIEPRAHGQDHIGVVHGQVGGVAAVHAEHADELTVRTRECAEAHQGVGHRQVEQLGQFGQRCGTAAQNHAAARVQHRTLGRQEHFCRLADLPRVPTNGRAVGTQLGFLREDVFEFLGRVGHVFRDIDHYRARATGLCEVERLFHDFRDFRGMLDHETVFHDRPGDTDHVGFLECIGTDHGASDLAGNDHHRDGVHISSRNAGNSIGCAWTGRYQYHAGFTGGTGITVSHMGCSLFVANQDVGNSRFLEQCVIDVQQSTTRVPVDIVNAFVTQKADEHLTAR